MKTPHEPENAVHEALDKLAAQDKTKAELVKLRYFVGMTIEEAAEVLEAIDRGTPAKLADELGDVLLQVVFHAQLASERGDFSVEDVCAKIVTKLKRRHPHVFAGETAATPEEVLVHWNAAKAAEKRERTSVLDGVSERMPSLALAQKMLGKGAPLGLGAAPVDAPSSEAELGEAFLGLVALAVNFLLLVVFLRALIAPLYLLASSVLALGATLGLSLLFFQNYLGQDDLTFYVPFAGSVLLLSLGSDYNIFAVGHVWQEARSRSFGCWKVAPLNDLGK